MLKNIAWIAGLLIISSACQTTSAVPQPVFSSPATVAPSEVPPAVILMIGDGMGVSQITAAMQSSQTPLNMESFPIVGFHKPYSASDLITDSAAGATAFACGRKTFNGAIGLGADTLPCPTLLEQAHAQGLATGLVATSSIVHATPAAFAGHRPLRIMYEGIASDMVTSGVDLLIGGGKRYFDRRYSDDRDLIDELQGKGYLVADYYSGDLSQVRPNPERGFVFFTADSGPLSVGQGRSYLAYASRLAAEFLSRRSDQGFFLVIEGSQIDMANHANEALWSIQETLDFDRAIGQVLEFAEQRGNTLVIVTADHESGGMAVRGDSRPGRVRVDWTTNIHTGTMVPVFAYGPTAEQFSGVYENTAIHYKIKSFLQLEGITPAASSLQQSPEMVEDQTLNKSSEREP
jgi:alkaline phosphatase